MIRDLPFAPPSPWITRFAPLLRAGARLLDVACGSGRHLRHFHGRGLAVTGVDIDLRGVADLAGLSGVTLLQADLEGPDGWPAALTGFDGIIVTNYLHRPLLPSLIAALKPGGLLLYETFANGNQRHGRPSSPAFLLREGELLRLAAQQGLQVIAFEQGEVSSPKAAIVQRLAAVRPIGPSPDLDGDPEPMPLPPASSSAVTVTENCGPQRPCPDHAPAGAAVALARLFARCRVINHQQIPGHKGTAGGLAFQGQNQAPHQNTCPVCVNYLIQTGKRPKTAGTERIGRDQVGNIAGRHQCRQGHAHRINTQPGHNGRSGFDDPGVTDRPAGDIQQHPTLTRRRGNTTCHRPRQRHGLILLRDAKPVGQGRMLGIVGQIV
ncbi:hypothetical protein CHU95_03960 [Niveispirillum lacus]|uniref:Methyltransferase domain-containing protein n=1 Tax=Niveispirillum lacus TaxID=1981099 RepID=A0A255Z554_9PROT|nr:class I SAM-dependent methyltransferase [Niveispirillum lacus]OYQ36561.1 hypothetical protein CHU95_03960 [Niveispirillum lacus]